MSKVSTIVYKDKGPHQRPYGTFDYKGVHGQAELDEALESGWFRTMPEAIEGRHAEVAPPASDVEVLGDDAPPTRAELKQQATELGIKFKKTTSDEALLKLINEALEG